MKTTLIGFGMCGEVVLKKCSDLPDTGFVLFSDTEAPSFVYQQQSPNYNGHLNVEFVINQMLMPFLFSIGKNTNEARRNMNENKI